LPRRILVSGASGGLGAAVAKLPGAEPLRRDRPMDDLGRGEPYDAIVHCAVNAARQESTAGLAGYVADNLLLTQRLMRVPHRKFIHVSSIDVYPLPRRIADETAEFDVQGLQGPYAHSKLFSEVLVRSGCANHLVLRPVTLLGPAMRPNSTLRLLTEAGCRLTLSGESRFNYVLHDDVARFIAAAIEMDLRGVLHLASRGAVKLADVARELGLRPHFGAHVYDVGEISNARIAALDAAFARSAAQTLNAFIDSLGSRFAGEGRLRA
jgi:nucleoside-diphosphate-sugar epimerase